MASDDPRLSQIQTSWTALDAAHGGPPDVAAAARAELLNRYGGAVRRYLRAATGDPDAADDLTQEFALRFLRGDFHHADPDRGRFRDYLKRAVRNLMRDRHRRRRGGPVPIPEEALEPAVLEPDPAGLDAQFLAGWREELLARAWQALARDQDPAGAPYHDVLRFRAEHPELHSPELAERLSAVLGRPVTAIWVRQVLLRARARFVAALEAEVAASLADPDADRIQEELAELGLLEYCRPARK
jgi:RNA polymerase sigma-70 factor (ECF subfamily)